MAWPVTKQGPIIQLVPDGSTDFSWASYFPDNAEGALIQEIQVYFSAANDVIDIRTHSTTGPRMFKYTTLDGASIAKRFYGGLLKPVIVNSEQTFGTAANVLIIIQTT